MAVVGMLVGAVAAPRAYAQPTEPINGPKHVDPGWHAIVNATVVSEPGAAPMEGATIVIRDGVIVSLMAGGEAPAGARVWDAEGMTVYAGLIEPYLEVSAPGPDAGAPGTHWSDKVRAQVSALDGEGLSSGEREWLRKAGYTLAHIAPNEGLLRGMSAVVTPGEDFSSASSAARVVVGESMHAMGFAGGGWGGGYPGSLMGVIAMERQMLADADWHARAEAAHRRDPREYARPAPSDALVAIAKPLPLMFDVDGELNTLRAIKVAHEFDRDAVLVTSGTEYRRLGAILDAIGAEREGGLSPRLVVPPVMADKPSVDDVAGRNEVSLRELLAWEQSPTNLARLVEGGAVVSVTGSKLPRGQGLMGNMRTAIEHGLDEDAALAMLTTNPAELLGVGDRYGRVALGMQASLVVVEGGLFDEDAKIRDVWVDGVRYEISAKPEFDLVGEYDARFLFETGVVEGTLIVEKGAKVRIELAGEGAGEDAKPEVVKARSARQREARMSFVVDGDAMGVDAALTMSAVFEGDSVTGLGVARSGETFTWSAERKPEEATDEDAMKDEAEGDGEGKDAVVPFAGLPFGGYAVEGSDDAPKTVVLTGATVWTSGPRGIIENGWVVLSGGKIQSVGSGSPPSAGSDGVVIDCKGKHITPGLIDCHSHTGISAGVNEGGQTVTAEVRIFDVIDPDDINWYRQLAGGITAVNQLHGSANPIGGQNSVVKLRWGAAHPDDMRFDGAVGGIKFALGENVTRSSGRYPDSRMGVATMIRDRFVAAQEYARAWERHQQRIEGIRRLRIVASEQDRMIDELLPPRRDLELEALVEILEGERLIHCHSYRQDEILMLCRIAEEFGFKIGTFQHVLEGYKVAEAIRENAIGGSSFSDWWAYKFEVFDAIPSNGSIMHDAGVVVSFNSDSDELARRMNGEAAKAVKYGGVEPSEALKFVTLNPAKQLMIDDRVGSIEAGKDADVVVWSGSPLSSMSRCERTFVDGVERFSLERDAELRARARSERDRLIQAIIGADRLEKAKKAEEDGEDGGGDDGDAVEEDPEMDLLMLAGSMRGDDLLAVYRERERRRAIEREMLHLILNGVDPTSSRPGECGCAAHTLY